MAASRVRLLGGVLAALPFGCALDGCRGSTERPGSGEAHDTATEAAPAATDGAPEAISADLPELGSEALAARTAAQTRLLGHRALFEDDAGRPVPAIEVHEDEDTIDDDILDALPGSSGIDVFDGGAGPAVNGNALGLYVPFEEPRESALAGFHAALRRLEQGADPGAKVRVVLYGASHTQADIYPEYLRTYLQERFGDGGAGFAALVPINRWHRPFRFSVSADKHWTVEHVQRSDAREDGRFGLAGASASTSRRRSSARLEPRDPTSPAAQGSRYELYFLRQPGGGKFTLWVDDHKHATISTHADQPQSGYHEVRLDPGPHGIEVRHAGGGEVRVFGVSVEGDRSGVVVDTLGISGTRASNHLAWDEEVWADNLRRRDPALFVLAYGTNETMDEDQPIESYREQLAAVIERFRRAAPAASCLLVGPGDFPREIEAGVWASRPRLAQIVRTQREIAWEHGCAFWDGVAFMGGSGSMHTWATSRPQMASSDHIHLTKRGYVRMGMAIADALMAGYDGATPVP